MVAFCLIIFILVGGIFGHDVVFHLESMVDTVGLTMMQFMELGVTHIVPKGLDHILFVVGLYLASLNWRELLWQVSAFTLAHTLTLGLTVLGVIALPASIVEPIIAASIAVIGIENMIFKQTPKWRWVVVFCFGLMHGMGFAGVVKDIGLPAERFWTALISFNVGVELGQLLVILLAFVLIGWARKKDGYRRYVLIPLNGLITIVGLFWFVERVWG